MISKNKLFIFGLIIGGISQMASADEVVDELKCESFDYYQDYFKGYQSRQLKDLRRHRENEKRNLESLLFSEVYL